MKLDDATRRQNRAAQPENSTWLSANAGSGKTRVLTDRVARLLLDKVKPQNILCLTYTKAAASEMQNRLFRRLGEWAMASDGRLADDLQRMGETAIGDPERLAEARRLFARAIETPGGLRIQTIHSFCASLLRRFPLEAGVSPAFAEMDDRSAERLREEVVEAIASGPDAAVLDGVARFYTGDDLGRLTRSITGAAEAFETPVTRADILGWFDVPSNLTVDGLLADVFLGGEAALFATLTAALTSSTKTTDQKAADRLAGIDWTAPGADELELLIGLMLTGSGAKEPFSAKIGTFPTKDCRAGLGPAEHHLNNLMLRVEAARPRLNALRAADRTEALHRFARVFLPAYEARKALRGWLDFDDLIQRTRRLLSDPGVAEWVLYKLDGGLDHILVDEAQDTSPTQWQVIERLAHEFATGQGARDGVSRTIFVVGDKKQSIYSFQGADPEQFDRMRDHFGTRLEDVGKPLVRLELEYSFRSSDAILRLVDTIFGDLAGDRMQLDARHRAFHGTLPGRVDLWPMVPPADKTEPPHWYDPLDMPSEDHHDVVLARQIARNIREMIGIETIPKPDGTRKRVSAGDFVILVRRRSTLFAEIIRACKAEGLAIAGADRLKLGGELAVKDLAALLRFLATPEDSLSLAAALRSPLFGWSEADLFDLAAGRSETYLWTTLRNRADSYADTLAVLNDLRGQSDFLRPYDLIERVLSRHDGRRKLLARLGHEAEDGIDSLLGQALAYERREVPSLTGFLTWLDTDEVEVKRQLDNAGDQIRVMTVHGAKGLESPIVILPDTAKRTLQIRDEIVRLDNGAPAWRTGAGTLPAAVDAALTRMKSAQMAEELRLFYVGLTRAETWLIVAGAGEAGDVGDSWHSFAQAGLERLGADPLATPAGRGLRYSHLDWDRGALKGDEAGAKPAVDLPAWVNEHVQPPEKVQTRSPSDLGGAKVLGGEGEGDLEASLRRGRQVHLLLEHLPLLPGDAWRDTAAGLLSQGEDAADEEELDDLLRAVTPMLRDRDLAWLFAPEVLSEVDVSATIPELDGQRIHGTIDKLVVGDDRVLAVDFKTNRIVPDRPEDVPPGLLRQMAAYDSALRQIYPDRVVETAILWTSVPRMMALPRDIVRAAMQVDSIS